MRLSIQWTGRTQVIAVVWPPSEEATIIFSTCCSSFLPHLHGIHPPPPPLAPELITISYSRERKVPTYLHVQEGVGLDRIHPVPHPQGCLAHEDRGIGGPHGACHGLRLADGDGSFRGRHRERWGNRPLKRRSHLYFQSRVYVRFCVCSRVDYSFYPRGRNANGKAQSSARRKFIQGGNL